MSQVSNPAAERSQVIENNGSETKNDGATDTVQWDYGVKHPTYSVDGIEEHLALKSLHWWSFTQRLIIIIFDM